MAQSVSIVRVSRALDVLANSSTEGMSLEDLAEAMEMSRSAATRLFESMVETGIAVRLGPRRYRLSLRTYEWGVKAVSIVGPSVAARREMSRLAAKTGCRVWYAVREGIFALTIERTELHDGDVLSFPVANRSPWWRTASGNIIAAFSAPKVQEELLASVCEQNSGNEDYRAVLDRVRHDGVAWHTREGLGTAIAVPVLDASSHGNASIALSVYSFEGVDSLVQPLKEAGARASDYFGYSQALLVT